MTKHEFMYEHNMEMINDLMEKYLEFQGADKSEETKVDDLKVLSTPSEIRGFL